MVNTVNPKDEDHPSPKCSRATDDEEEKTEAESDKDEEDEEKNSGVDEQEQDEDQQDQNLNQNVLLNNSNVTANEPEHSRKAEQKSESSSDRNPGNQVQGQSTKSTKPTPNEQSSSTTISSTEAPTSTTSTTVKPVPQLISFAEPQFGSCSTKLNLPQIPQNVSDKIAKRLKSSFKREAKRAKLRAAALARRSAKPKPSGQSSTPMSAAEEINRIRITTSSAPPSTSTRSTSNEISIINFTTQTASSTTADDHSKTSHYVKPEQEHNNDSAKFVERYIVPRPWRPEVTPASPLGTSWYTSYTSSTDPRSANAKNSMNNKGATTTGLAAASTNPCTRDPRLRAVVKDPGTTASVIPGGNGGGASSNNKGVPTKDVTHSNVKNSTSLEEVYRNIKEIQKTDPARALRMLIDLGNTPQSLNANINFNFIPPQAQPSASASAYSRYLSPPPSTVLLNLPPTLNLNARFLIKAEPPLPPNWESNYSQALHVASPFLRLSISESSDEFRVLSGLIAPSTRCTIKSAQRIINTELWKRFIAARKESIINKSSDWNLLAQLGLSTEEIERKKLVHSNFQRNPDLNEVPYLDNIALLWHGSRQHGNIDKVLTQGLDERLGNSGHFGRGIYFSDDPHKAMHYDRNGTLFLFAVFLGDCLSVDHLQDKKSIVREPEKAQLEKRNHLDSFFDSIVGRTSGPVNEYVIYNRHQCVPLYTIQYEKNINLEAPDKGKLYDIYYGSRKNIPSFAWMPSFRRNKYQVGQQNYQFYARTVFDLMEEEKVSASTSTSSTSMEVEEPQKASSSTGSTATATIYNKLLRIASNNNEIKQDNVNTQTQDIDELELKLKSLSELGFKNGKKNKELLLKFGYDVDATAAYLLDHDTEADSNLHSGNGTTTTTTCTSSTATATTVNANVPSSSQSFMNPTPTSSCRIWSISSTSTPAATHNANELKSRSLEISFDPSTKLSLRRLSIGTNPVIGSSSTNKQSPSKRAKLNAPEILNIVNPGKGGTKKSPKKSHSRSNVTTSTGPAEPTNVGTTQASLTAAAPTSTLEDGDEQCPICTVEYPKDFVNWKTLTCCSNKLCTICYSRIRVTATTMSGQTSTFSKCPFCFKTNGIEIGNCPNGSMNVKYLCGPPAAGYEQYATIQIQYIVSSRNDGSSSSSSPTKNLRVNRVAFLPKTLEGERVLRLLKTAWDRRLIFTIGTSGTTGVENTLVWNIHHKTSLDGGVTRHGYPDPTYLKRVQQELAQYDIV